MLTILTAVALAAPNIDTPLRTGAQHVDDAAVVIGNEAYAFAPDVPYAVRDARSFRDALVYTRGVAPDRVQLLEGASREKILGAVKRAEAEVGPNGVLWIYYAGHGAADPDTSERLLLGDDVRLDPDIFASRGVRLSELTERKRPTVLVLDTCYSGVGRDDQALFNGARFAVPAYAADPHNAVVWTATSGDETAMPLESVQHGAFTWLVVGAMRGWADGQLDGVPDGVVTLSEAQEYVSRGLRHLQKRNQTPELLGDGGQVLVRASSLEPPPDLDAIQAASSRASATVTKQSTTQTGPPRPELSLGVYWGTADFEPSDSSESTIQYLFTSMTIGLGIRSGRFFNTRAALLSGKGELNYGSDSGLAVGALVSEELSYPIGRVGGRADNLDRNIEPYAALQLAYVMGDTPKHNLYLGYNGGIRLAWLWLQGGVQSVLLPSSFSLESGLTASKPSPSATVQAGIRLSVPMAK